LKTRLKYSQVTIRFLSNSLDELARALGSREEGVVGSDGVQDGFLAPIILSMLAGGTKSLVIGRTDEATVSSNTGIDVGAKGNADSAVISTVPVAGVISEALVVNLVSPPLSTVFSSCSGCAGPCRVSFRAEKKLDFVEELVLEESVDFVDFSESMVLVDFADWPDFVDRPDFPDFVDAAEDFVASVAFFFSTNLSCLD